MQNGIRFFTGKEFISLITGRPVSKWKYAIDSSGYSKRSYIQLRRDRPLIESCFIASTSWMPIYKDKNQYWSGKMHKREYGHQYCMRCPNEFEDVSWKDGKLVGVYIFIERLTGGDRLMHFLCSKKCYDAVRIDKMRNPINHRFAD